MSSKKSSSSFADPRPRPQVPAQPLQDLHDDTYLPATDDDVNHLLSPYTYARSISASASPSYQVSSTPGDDLSEYSTYQPSEQYSDFTDEFFGINFDAGIHRVDSLPFSLVNGAAHQSLEVNKVLSDQAIHKAKTPSRPLGASPFPPSPDQSTTPSPKNEAHEAKAATLVSQKETVSDLHNLRIPSSSSFITTNPSSSQLTPDNSGSSHTSGEGFEPSIMAQAEQSPHVMVSQWDFQPSTQAGPFQTQNQTRDDQQSLDLGAQEMQSSIHRDDEGQWAPNASTGQAGLDPESRQMLSDEEIPTLKEQEEQRRIRRKNSEVEEWRSNAGGSPNAVVENQASYFALKRQPTDVSSIPAVDDAASIRDNRLLDGQTYFNLGNNYPTPPTQDDFTLMTQPRQFNDAPALPYMTSTRDLPPTANDAIRRWNGTADTFSLSSRVATWGTRRKSEPSLKDYEAIADGSFLKKLSISRAPSRQNSSLFDQGLDRLASIVRKTSNSGLKRARGSLSPEEITEPPQNAPPAQPPNNRNNSQGSLLSLPRSPSFGRRQTPSINTALAAMTGPLAAVGTTHARSGSVSGLATSPKSPSHLGGLASRVIHRARSRSELSPHDKSTNPGLLGLLRGHGGPPVANLATDHGVEVKPRPEVLDAEDDEDDDDELGDEGDMKEASEQDTDPIQPNYDGFKAHVRQLNPEMDPRYHWLVSRIAHQQEIRYKSLLEMRVKHYQVIQNGHCSAGHHCIALGGSAILLDAKGKPRDSISHSSMYGAEASDDSNPGEGALSDETFPTGVPMPPTRNLPAEFECQLCFKSKKFQKPSDWTKHVHEDVQPFTCTYEKCKEPKSFKRKADWVRHENERHRHLEWWVCQIDDCRHPCYRKDNFLQHLVREHKLPEPKQKTKAAIKKARTTEIAWIMLEKCHHDTENKPQDEPCKFCGKTFTTWKKLTVHLAKHMEHISLPVLKLVGQRKVDADTVISPVEQNLTPIAPVAMTKLESSSPIHMSGQASSMIPQFSTYDQSAFFPASTAQPPAYRLQTPMQTEMYEQNFMFAPYSGPQPVEQARTYGSTDSSSLSQMDQSRGFGSMGSSYSNSGPHNYNVQQHTDYSVPQNYASGPPSVSGYQTANMMGMADAGSYGYNTVATATGQHAYPQMPMSRSAGSPSPFGGDGSEHNLHHYSH